MTHEAVDNLFAPGELPEDVRTSDGKRHRDSKWNTFRQKRLQVLQSDIDGAMRENSQSCMIADAIKRQVVGADKVTVDIATIRWTDTKLNRRIVCLTPMVCQQGLVQFDLGRSVQPFAFDLKSAQITTARLKRVAPSERRKPGPKPKAAGVVETVVAAKREREWVPVPKARVETARTERVTVLGGDAPPQHHGSRFRKFGVKGFSWEDGEDKEVVARRLEAANRRQIVRSDGLRFNTLVAAAASVGKKSSNISRALRTGMVAFGFGWRYDFGDE